jgi:putative endonuclease
MADSPPTVVYLVGCADDSLYVGHAADVAVREQAHNDGRGAAYTRDRRPVRVVFTEPHASLESAVRRERQIKRWSRAKKEALVAGSMQGLKQLAQRRKR